MTVAFDAASESHTGITGSASEASFSWSHDPVGTPKGVLVFTFMAANANEATAVTYDGVSLTAVTGGRALDTAGEPGDCKAWFLGSGVPATDPATVVVTRTNTANTIWAMAITVTAGGNTQISGTPVLLENDGTLAEQNVDSGTDSALRFAGLNSGLASVPTAGANSTLLSADIDFGNRVMCAVRETTAGSGSRPVGFSSGTSDDRAGVHLAIAEQAVTLVVQDAVHAHATDGIALTQAHVLAVQDATHSQALDALGLTQVHALAVADALHGHTLDNLTVGAVHQLAVQDALHAHALDGVVLAQNHFLTIQDLLHAQVLDAVGLQEVHNLAVQDALHAHVVDPVSLAVSHNLAVNDALHVHLLDSLTLSHHIIWLPTFRRTTVGGVRTMGEGTYGEGTYGGSDWESAVGTLRRRSVVTLRRG